MKKIAAVLLVIALYVPQYAHAETVLRIGENVSVEADQVVDGDYYVSVGPLGNTSMSGTVAQDMYAFGGVVDVNGIIGNDLTLVGGTSQLHATVTDDVRIIAGEVTVAEHIGGDLFVIGGKLNMLSTASVDGDVIFFGGDAEINGTVGGSVLGTSERIRVDATVGKDVDVKTATALTLGERAQVGGSVRYASVDPLVRAQNASVEGEVVTNDYYDSMASAPERDLRGALVPLFMTLFASLSLYLLFRKELQLLVQSVLLHPLRHAVAGIAVLILGPVVSIILLLTVLGSLIGIAGLCLTLLLYVLGYALSGVVVGAFVSRLFTRKATVSLLWVVIGTILLYAVLLVPIVGVMCGIAVFIFTIGGVALSLYKLLS